MRLSPFAAVPLLLAAATPAWADDTYTFKVPLEVHSLSTQLSKVKAECQVYTEPTPPPAGHGENYAVAQNWSEELPLDSTGSASGTVTVTVTVKPGSPKIRRWGCLILGKFPSGQLANFFWPNAGAQPQDDAEKPKPMTEFVPRVGGSF